MVEGGEVDGDVEGKSIEHRAESSSRFAVGSSQLAKCSLAVGSLQLAVFSWQSSVGSSRQVKKLICVNLRNLRPQTVKGKVVKQT